MAPWTTTGHNETYNWFKDFKDDRTLMMLGQKNHQPA